MDEKILNRLRIAFWREYERAQSTKTMMLLANITSGIVSYQVFKKHFESHATRMAFIITPPQDYDTVIAEMFSIGLEQMRDILVSPHVDEQGKINTRLADVKIRIVESLHSRIKGGVVQRVEQKNLNVNVNKESNQALQSMEDIDKRLAELSTRVGQLQIGGGFDGQVREADALELADSQDTDGDR